LQPAQAHSRPTLQHSFAVHIGINI